MPVPDPATLKRIQEMTEALNRCGVTTLEDLRRCISKDVDAGINWTVINTGAQPALLTALLIAEVREDTAPSGKRKLWRYWRELKTLPAVLLLSAAEVRDLWRALGARSLWRGRGAAWAVIRQSLVRPKHLLYNWRRHWLDMLLLLTLALFVAGVWVGINQIKRQRVERVAVKGTTPLPAFHRIDDEVEMKRAPGASKAFATAEEVRGRYTLAPIPAGEILRPGELLSAELSEKMRGRRIISVPLKAGTYGSAVQPPTEAFMILSPAKPEVKAAEPVVLDVIVLKIEKTAESTSATIALAEDNFRAAAPLLASHEVFLSQSAP